MRSAIQLERNKSASSFGAWKQVFQYCQEEDWEETFHRQVAGCISVLQIHNFATHQIEVYAP